MWAPQTLFKPDSYDDLITGKIPALIVPEILSKLNVHRYAVKYQISKQQMEILKNLEPLLALIFMKSQNIFQMQNGQMTP